MRIPTRGFYCAIFHAFGTSCIRQPHSLQWAALYSFVAPFLSNKIATIFETHVMLQLSLDCVVRQLRQSCTVFGGPLRIMAPKCMAHILPTKWNRSNSAQVSEPWNVNGGLKDFKCADFDDVLFLIYHVRAPSYRHVPHTAQNAGSRWQS